MAGRLTVSTLNNDTGPLAVQNGMTGIAKAWVAFTGSTAAITGSFNVSSITRIGTGQYTVNYTTAMSNINYSVACAGSNYLSQSGNPAFISYFSSGATGYIAPTTTSFNFACLSYNAGVYQDPTLVTAIVMGI